MTGRATAGMVFDAVAGLIAWGGVRCTDAESSDANSLIRALLIGLAGGGGSVFGMAKSASGLSTSGSLLTDGASTG